MAMPMVMLMAILVVVVMNLDSSSTFDVRVRVDNLLRLRLVPQLVSFGLASIFILPGPI